MTVITNVSGDATKKLVTIIGEAIGSDSFITSSLALISSSNNHALISSFLVPDVLPAILEMDEDTVVGTFGLLSYLVGSVEEGKQEALSTAIITSLSSSTSKPPTTILTCLVNHQNIRPPTSCKYNALVKATEYAIENGMFNSIKGSFERLEDTVAEWRLKGSEIRNIYNIVARGYTSLGDSSTCQSWIVKSLQTFDSFNEPVDSTGVETAVKAVIEAIKSPLKIFGGSGLSGLKVLEELKSKNSDIISLLEIFSTGNLTDFLTYSKSNSSTFKKHSLNLEECTKNMRLLSLCTLASSSPILSYASVAEVMQVSENTVEVWIVHAIQAGLIEGRMDQVEKNVVVERAVCRGKGEKEWKGLEGRLEGLVGEVERVMEGLERKE
ncbi:hypothetical protein TL16_g03933 [Triparma laevis f. inornata]|uniref:PCI domain-containing protein n=1 Tax=Triparma laevis f. inornata TaxID=1714386 RepID=A0A9W7A7Z6_9STRA|nr:hypothetical protein TL16_g03933 [Triparma laevis f. inornata]